VLGPNEVLHNVGTACTSSTVAEPLSTGRGVASHHTGGVCVATVGAGMFRDCVFDDFIIIHAVLVIDVVSVSRCTVILRGLGLCGVEGLLTVLGVHVQKMEIHRVIRKVHMAQEIHIIIIFIWQ
jgi:hypothetical protein